MALPPVLMKLDSVICFASFKSQTLASLIVLCTNEAVIWVWEFLSTLLAMLCWLVWLLKLLVFSEASSYICLEICMFTATIYKVYVVYKCFVLTRFLILSWTLRLRVLTTSDLSIWSWSVTIHTKRFRWRCRCDGGYYFNNEFVLRSFNGFRIRFLLLIILLLLVFRILGKIDRFLISFLILTTLEKHYFQKG